MAFCPQSGNTDTWLANLIFGESGSPVTIVDCAVNNAYRCPGTAGVGTPVFFFLHWLPILLFDRTRED